MDILKIYPKSSKILIIGPYPPPIGGVSVHTKRLLAILNKNGFCVELFHTSIAFKSKIKSFFNLIRLIYMNEYDIVHVQYYFRGYSSIVLLLKYFKKFNLYYTDHNPRLFEDRNKFSYYIRKKFIENTDYLVIVAEHIIETYKLNKVRLPKKFIVKNAFLPPPLEEDKQIWHTYSNETKEFIHCHKILIIASAWKISFHKNIDLYGLDLCIELANRLRKTFPQCGILFALANDGVNVDYIDKSKRQIETLDLRDNFHFMTGQKELWPLFRKADLSIRPTATDGDALTLRESLYFNCPVIASDVVPRPEGTIIFKSRDIDDLYFQVSNILSQKNTKTT